MTVVQPIVEVPLLSWRNYLELISDWIESGRNGQQVDEFWFRGQASSTFNLVASLDRSLKEQSPATRNDVETEMVKVFKNRTETEDELQGLEAEQVLSILQHYGAPTRLLDWTTSPYIAAFFAFAGDQARRSIAGAPSDMVSVWAIRPQDESIRGKVGVVPFEPIARGNERIGAQHGRFTRTTSNLESVDAHVLDYYARRAPGSTVLYHFMIPQSDASRALRTLEQMGISSETMFKGLEGVSRYSFFRALDLSKLLEG